jgi:hypothetical protein
MLVTVGESVTNKLKSSKFMMPYDLKADILLYIPDCNKGRSAFQ